MNLGYDYLFIYSHLIDQIHQIVWNFVIFCPNDPILTPPWSPHGGGLNLKYVLNDQMMFICLETSINYPFFVENCKKTLFSYIFYCFL